ncbi:MAG: hypothetical protein WBP88_13625 [Nitrososphaeraceae archaeon]
MAELYRFKPKEERSFEKVDDAKNLNPDKLENIEEKIVTVTLETILLNASWLFLTSKDDLVKRTMLNQDNRQGIVEWT